MLCLLCSCSGAPEIKRELTVSEADSVEVSCTSAAGKQLVLRSKAASIRALDAGARPDNVVAKELLGPAMQNLLDALATYDFFRLAAMPRRELGRSQISVDVNGRRYVAGSALANTADLERWTSCLAIFQDVFNRTPTGQDQPGISRELREQIERQAREPSKQ